MTRNIVDYIKLEDLKIGQRYELRGRNFQEGVWNGEGFEGMRTKWGHTFLDVELHWDSDPHYGTVKPIKEV